MFWKFWHKDVSLTTAPIEKVCNTSRSPCEKCGACCAFFRVCFTSDEQGEKSNVAVLEKISVPAGLLRRVMKGTEGSYPRCIALEGHVGLKVRCTIYDDRPSSCRDFTRSWEKNIGNILCDRARAVYGLQPFSQY